MGRLTISCLMLAASCLPACAYQWVNINNDVRNAGYIEANTAMQVGIEEQQRMTLDTIRKKKQNMSLKLGLILSAKMMHRASKANHRGFTPGTSIYTQIGKHAANIVALTPKVLAEVRKARPAAMTKVILETTSLMTATYGCVNNFISIVTNGTVKSPLENNDAASPGEVGEKIDSIRFVPIKGHEGAVPVGQPTDTPSPGGIGASAEGQKDGVNLLDRSERLKTARDILKDLKTIERKMWSIIFWAKCGRWSSVFTHLDPQSYGNYLIGKAIAERTIKRWNGLMN